jgi:hypothetical protein
LLTSNVADFPAADDGPAYRVLHPGTLFGELAGSYPMGDALRRRTDDDHGCLLLPATGSFPADAAGKSHDH